MKIFIAGGAGYMGSRLTGVLIENGHTVTVLDRMWFGSALPKEVKVIKKDIFEIDVETLKGFDEVIFLAGLSNDPMAEYSPARNFIYNSAAPAYLAYEAKRAGVKRYVYACSASVYGFTDNKPLNEKSVAKSAYPYGMSKLQGEFSVMGLADDNFSVISLRKGTISGWSPRMRFDLIVNTMYMKARTTGEITVNNPTIWRPILGINDAISAYMLAVGAPTLTSGVFNVSSGNFTVLDIAKKVQKHFKNKFDKEITITINNVPDKRNYKMSTDKAERILNFAPKDNIETILDELDSHFGPKFDFSKEKYYNIQVFKKKLDAKINDER